MVTLRLYKRQGEMMNRSIRPSTRPLIHGDIVKRANLFRFVREFVEAQNMGSGYYMEFGVLNGECMIDAYRQFRGLFSHYFGFDSFEGLPELTSDDQKASILSPGFHKGNFASMQLEYVQQTILSSSRMPSDELSLVRGFFNESLPKICKDDLKKYGVPLVMYVDCDLYSSTVDVLQFIGDLAVTGTWIFFDDYWCYRGSPHEGEQRAIREWLDSNDRIGLQPYCNFDGWGRAFIAYEK
jgi:O-methyltransferase